MCKDGMDSVKRDPCVCDRCGVGIQLSDMKLEFPEESQGRGFSCKVTCQACKHDNPRKAKSTKYPDSPNGVNNKE